MRAKWNAVYSRVLYGFFMVAGLVMIAAAGTKWELQDEVGSKETFGLSPPPPGSRSAAGTKLPLATHCKGEGLLRTRSPSPLSSLVAAGSAVQVELPLLQLSPTTLDGGERLDVPFRHEGTAMPSRPIRTVRPSGGCNLRDCGHVVVEDRRDSGMSSPSPQFGGHLDHSACISRKSCMIRSRSACVRRSGCP